jgi:hypothetical protein
MLMLNYPHKGVLLPLPQESRAGEPTKLLFSYYCKCAGIRAPEVPSKLPGFLPKVTLLNWGEV